VNVTGGGVAGPCPDTVLQPANGLTRQRKRADDLNERGTETLHDDMLASLKKKAIYLE
jgi:hypothetical protein